MSDPEMINKKRLKRLKNTGEQINALKTELNNLKKCFENGPTPSPEETVQRINNVLAHCRSLEEEKRKI